MNSDELYDSFRTDVQDVVSTYLWLDTEVWRYMNEAYFMFVRLTGGIPDFTSSATYVPIAAGINTSPIDPSILRIMSAYRASDNAEINIINSTDTPVVRDNDYGSVKPLWLDNTPGPVRHMLIGAQQNLVKWIQVPIADDAANLVIYRLPLAKITDAGGQEFIDVSEEHHYSLLMWMKALAYKKQDAETFDRATSAENGAEFRAYCMQAKQEMERKKHKTRVVAYGGI